MVGSVCPAVQLSVLPSVWVFSWNWIISFFLNFGMVLETGMKLCVKESDIVEKLFLPQKIEKMVKNRPKIGFLHLKNNLVINFHWICSMMKIYIIFCVPGQIPYLGKIFFLRYRTKCSKCTIFKSTISPEQIDETASFFAYWYKFTKIKNWLKSFGWIWSKLGLAKLVLVF